MARRYINVDDSAFEVASTIITGSPFTMSSWILSNSGVQYWGSFADLSSSNQYYTGWTTGSTETPNRTFRWTSRSAGSGQAVTTNQYTAGEWSHVCARERSPGNDRDAILNGDIANAGTNGANRTPNNIDTWSLGKLAGGSEAWAQDGDQAEFAIWDEALSDAEVISLSKGFSPRLIRPHALIIHVSFNERAGDIRDVVSGTILLEEATAVGASAHPPIIRPRGQRIFIPPVAGGQTIMVNQVTETDLAQPITWAPKIRIIGQVTETDLAQPITWAPKIRIIGQVTETNLAQPISLELRRLVNQVTETDLAQPISLELRRLVNQVTETDLAQSITVDAGLTATVNQVTETDLAQPITVELRRLVNLVTEIDLAQPITVELRRLVNLVTETDLAQPISLELRRLVNLVTETDLAQPISLELRRLVNQVTETDLAQTITPQLGGGGQTVTVNQITETDLAQLITVELRRLVTLVTETDLAQPITWAPKIRIIGQIAEIDLAQPISVEVRRLINLVTETDLAQPISVELRRLVTQVIETDLAQPIIAELRKLVTQVIETNLAQSVTPVIGGLGPITDPGIGDSLDIYDVDDIPDIYGVA